MRCVPGTATRFDGRGTTHVFKACRLLVGVSLLLAMASVCLAEDRVQVSVHRACVSGGAGERLYLNYWYPGVNENIPEPVCVLKTPEFGGVPFRSVRITQEKSQSSANIVVEFDEAARPLIEKMTAANVGKLLAIVVADRIVAMQEIWKAHSDNRLLIVVRSKNEANRILAALNSGRPPDDK